MSQLRSPDLLSRRGSGLKTLFLYVDGASRGNPGASAIGASLQDSSGNEIAYLSVRIGETTNNVAEYTALIEGLKLARERGCDDVEVRSDSQLLIRQLMGEYRVKVTHLKPLWTQATEILKSFRSFRLEHIPRERNRRADELANQALDRVE